MVFCKACFLQKIEVSYHDENTVKSLKILIELKNFENSVYQLRQRKFKFIYPNSLFRATAATQLTGFSTILLYVWLLNTYNVKLFSWSEVTPGHQRHSGSSQISHKMHVSMKVKDKMQVANLVKHCTAHAKFITSFMFISFH